MKFAIVSMVRTGMMQTNVAVHFSISKSTVSKTLKRFKDSNSPIKKKRGPKFKLSDKEKEFYNVFYRKTTKNHCLQQSVSSERTIVTNYLSKQYADTSTNADYVTMQQYQNHIVTMSYCRKKEMV